MVFKGKTTQKRAIKGYDNTLEMLLFWDSCLVSNPEFEISDPVTSRGHKTRRLLKWSHSVYSYESLESHKWFGLFAVSLP